MPIVLSDSQRSYISSLLWKAQGITAKNNLERAELVCLSEELARCRELIEQSPVVNGEDGSLVKQEYAARV